MAQTNDEGLAFLQFNFLNPGARALAMGGAFVALTDDATAAQANPAGLTILNRPQISVEYSATNYQNRIPWESGKIIVTQLPDSTFHDFEFDLNAKNFPQTLNNLSFLSLTYPVLVDRFVLSGFYNEQSKFKRQVRTERIDVCSRTGVECANYSPNENHVSLSIKNFGASAALQLSRQISAGFSVVFSKLNLQSRSRRIGSDENGIPDFNKTLFIQSLEGDDQKASYSAGILYKATPFISAGFAYNRRPEFSTQCVFVVTQPPLTQITAQKFKVPDYYSLGVSLKPNDVVILNLDVVRVLYSQLMDGYYNAYYSPHFIGSKLFVKDFQRNTLEVDDGTELRLGGEYVAFFKNRPLALRGGYWHEPFHSINQTREDAALVEYPDKRNDIRADPYTTRSNRKDYNHFTIGAGMVFKYASLDLGYDYSNNFRRFILSSVFYFQ